jgi:hypothetical protein
VLYILVIQVSSKTYENGKRRLKHVVEATLIKKKCMRPRKTVVLMVMMEVILPITL